MKDKFSIPIIDEVNDELTRAQVLSILDLRDEYHK